MAEYLVVNNADDGEQNNTAWSVAASNWVSNSSKFAADGDDRAGIRFQNINIDQGATVSSATLDLYIDRIYREPEMQAHAVDADNAAQFSSSNLPTSNTLTTALGVYDFAGEGVPTGYGVINARRVIDVTTVVQEVLDRGSWVSGNSIAFVISTLLESNKTWGYVYDSAAGSTYEPKLNITAADGVLAADSGSYSYSGTDVALTYAPSDAFTLPADSGSYTVSGTAVDLQAGRVLVTDSGAYSYAGTAADLTYAPSGTFTLSVDSGSYIVSGAAVDLQVGLVLSVDSGAYTVSGTAIGFPGGRVLATDSGSYAVSGTSVGLGFGVNLGLDSGAYTVSGNAVSLLTGSVLNALSGSYLYNGPVINLAASGQVLIGRVMYTLIEDRTMIVNNLERKMVI